MKKNWDMKKLGEVCEFRNGLWTGKKPPFQKVRVIRNTNFTKDGELDTSEIVYLDVEQSQFAKRKLEYGDIILEKSGGGPKQPVGRVILFDKEEGDFSFSNFTSIIRIKNKIYIDFKYLHKYLYFSYISGITETMQSRSTGIRNLKFDEYKNIEIPIPPLDEQQRIVAVLDKAFAAIATAKGYAERNLQNSKELFQSYLHNVFANKGEGWEEKKLGEVCEFDKTPNRKIDLPYVGLEDIESNSGKFIGSTKPQNVKSLTFYFTHEHVLYGRLRPYLNKVLLPNFEGHCSTEIFPIRAIQKLDKKFLFHWLLSHKTVNKINATCTGARMPRANMNTVLEFEIPLPPLAEQQRIVAKLEALSEQTKNLESIYRLKIADLEELKKSILQKAFNGEL